MSMIGRNSSLFKGEPVVAQPVPVANASPRQLSSYEARKARLARLSVAAAKARQSRERMEAKRPPVDIALETIKRAASKPLPQITQRDVLDVSIKFKFKHELSVTDIQRIIATHHGITLDDIRGPRRFRKFSRPRQLAAFCVWSLKPSLSLPEIGRRSGGRDHTTILWAVRKISREYQASTRMNAYYVARTILADAGYIWPEQQTEGEGE